MNSLFFGICIIGVGGGIFMLHFLIMILRKWLDTRWLKLHGLETSARILEAQVINEAGRYLPFVRLKIEINTDRQERFVAEIHSFFALHDLPALVTGNDICVKYNPSDVTQVGMVKQKLSAGSPRLAFAQ